MPRAYCDGAPQLVAREARSHVTPSIGSPCYSTTMLAAFIAFGGLAPYAAALPTWRSERPVRA